jgi:hypothetical protein
MWCTTALAAETNPGIEGQRHLLIQQGQCGLRAIPAVDRLVNHLHACSSGSSQPASPVEPCQMTDETGAGASQANGVGLVRPCPATMKARTRSAILASRRRPPRSLERLEGRTVLRPHLRLGVAPRHLDPPGTIGEVIDRRASFASRAAKS